MLEALAFGPDGWGDEMLRGMAMTIAVAVAAFLTGVVVGSAAAAAKLSGNRALVILAEVYTTVVRGVPELLVIYLLFFAG